MHPLYHHHGHVLIFLIFAKSNDITKKFVKSILVQKIAYTSIYESTMSPKQFEIKNKELRIITVKNRHLSTVPLNFDCSRGLEVKVLLSETIERKKREYIPQSQTN